MKNLNRVLLVILLMISSSAIAQPFHGNWLGAMTIPNGPTIRLALEVFERADGSTGVNLSSPDQGVRYLRAELVSISEKEINVRALGIPMTLSASLNPQRQLNARFSQGGLELDFTMQSVSTIPETLSRQSQTVANHYVEYEVSYPSNAPQVYLSGTLSVPNGEEKHPAVILVAGSGPADRDASHGPHRPFRVLADHLAERGFVVLRADKRGVFKSTGDFTTASPSNLTQDLLGAITFLSNHAAVDAEEIAVVGHSEGSLIAAMAASETNLIDAIVSLAGPGFPVIDILKKQELDEAELAGADSTALAQVAAFSDLYYETVLAAENEQERLELLNGIWQQAQETHPLAAQYLAPSGTLAPSFAATDSFVDLLTADPADAWHRVKQPVLLMNGGLDMQVIPDNVLELEKILQQRSEPEGYSVYIPAQINHMLQTATTGSENEYNSIEETVSAEVLERVTQWLRQQSN